MLLNKLSRYIKEKKDEGVNIKVRRYQGEPEFANSGLYKITEHKKVQIVEENDQKLRTKPVEFNTDNSAFTYFLDGIERKRVLFNYNYIPVTYGYVAAVILKRTNKIMHSVNLEVESENIYLPYKTDDDAPEHYFNKNDFSEYGFIPINIGRKDNQTKKYPIFPEEFEQNAHNEIQETRRKLEQDLAKKWLSQKLDKDWLFVDGGLTRISEDLMEDSRVVGIIKSHHIHYFEPEDQYKIYELKKGQRTSVFQPDAEEGRAGKKKIYSWYLRLHDKNYSGDNNFGIIRVEVPAKEELLSKVDDISSWILLETKPIAFPASRWDRMIYPIKYCEDYLKSKAPSWAMIESLS